MLRNILKMGLWFNRENLGFAIQGQGFESPWLHQFYLEIRNMIKIVRIKKIKDTYFTEWFGRTEKNEPVQIVFKRGKLTVRIGKKDYSYWYAVNGEVIIFKEVKTKYSGWLDYKDLVSLCKEEIMFPEAEDKEPFLGCNLVF